MTSPSPMGENRPNSAQSVDHLAAIDRLHDSALAHLEAEVAELREKYKRNALATRLLSEKFHDLGNPYECVHTALSRAVGLAGLLNELFDAGDMDDRVHRALTPGHLAYTAEILKHEIRSALLLLDDFWRNGGGHEAWRSRQTEGEGA